MNTKRALIALAAALTLLVVTGTVALSQSTDPKDVLIEDAIATLNEALAVPATTVTETVTETVTLPPTTVTETVTETPPPPTTDPPTTTTTTPPPTGEIPPTANLQPQRTPQQAASDTFFNIDMRHLDLPSGPAGLLWRQQFNVSGGWEFYDRWHYSCVSMYLQNAGARVAQIVYRTAEGAAYTQLNDAHGNEMGEGSWTGFPSQCALPQGPGLGPQEEIEEKPAGLVDEVVQFQSGGVTFATFVCPATSSRNADTWCEVDEEGSTPNHVTLEVYWEDDLIVAIDIDRMSANVEIVA